MIQVARYDKSQETEWNSFVGRSKNGTFLFNRGFMDYHADRFTDASLVFRDAKGDVYGLLPANYDQGLQMVVSHGGLTYGGLIISGKVTQTSVNAMLALAAAFYGKAVPRDGFLFMCCYRAAAPMIPASLPNCAACIIGWGRLSPAKQLAAT